MSLKSPVKDTDNFFIGEDRVLKFTIVDAAGAAQDITGWTLEWTLRETPEDNSVVLTKTSPSDGIALTNAVGGIYQVTLPRTDTLLLDEKTYFYTTRRTDAGHATVLAFGDFVVAEAASR